MRDSLRPAAHCGDLADRSLVRSSAPQPLGDADRSAEPNQPAPHRFWQNLFADRCRTQPEHPALVDTQQGRQLSYGELQRRVQDRVGALRSAGVGAESAVAVLLPGGIERIVTLLAVVASGGAYVSLDPSYPARRWQLMLEDTQASLLIRDDSFPPDCTVPETCRQLTLEHLDAHGGQTSHHDREDGDPVLPEAAAYVIYTSGSTGRPRGVTISHRALAWYTAACIDHYALTPRDRLPQMASIGFDISVGEIFPCLAAGATLQLPPPGPLGADELLAFCRQWETTLLFPATALWHELARHVGDDPQSLPPSLRLISFGGEKVSDKLLATWLATVGDRVQLINGYGPTEATVEATLHDLTQAMSTSDPLATTAAIIGHPVAGVRCHILDAGGLPVVEGEVGELCIDSPGLARGYLGHPSKTASKFIPNPFSSRPGARLYRSGDLVRRSNDGRLEILGRLDLQVKVRGYRVEPGEIESHLQQHPQVAEAHVVAVGSGSEELHLVACIVPHRDASSAPSKNSPNGDDVAPPSAAVSSATGILGVGAVSSSPRPDRDLPWLLRRYLQQLLPPHHVPGHILVLPKLPLNDRRKVDRFRLVRLAEGSLRAVGLDDDASGSRSLEHRLAQIWRLVLRLEEVGVDDDFFHLGGDSILAIRVVAGAHTQGLRISPREIFELRTVRRLADLVRRRQHQDAEQRSDEKTYQKLLSPGPHDAAPLTPVQHWFFDEAELGDPNHFNQSMLVRLHAPDVPRLRRALDQLVQHHEALRLRFRQSAEGAWQQRVQPREEADLLRPLPSDPSLWVESTSALQASLNIEHGPVLRCGLQDGGESKPSRLLICIHHLVVDGVTWGILLQDLEQLYLQLEAPAPALDVPTPYRGWALLQDHVAQQTTTLDELPFWLAQYQPAPSLPLDLDGPRLEGAHPLQSNTLQSTATVTMHLSRLQTRQLLREIPAAYRTRINDVLLCAVAMALTEGQAERRCRIDVEGHGREELVPGVDLSRTAGWFTSTFPLLLSLPSANLRQSLIAIKEQLRRVPHHGIGFGWLYALCRHPDVRQRLDGVGHPEISFNYLGQLDALLRHSRVFTADDAPRGAEKCAEGLRPYVLEIDGGVVDGRLWLNWHYSRHLHQRQTIETLAHRCQHNLIQLIDHCLDPDVGSLTPSDVRLSALGQDQLDALPLPHRHIADLYPLAPMQEGMLFHHRLHPTSTVYFEQSAWTLEGPLDPSRWHTAWQHLVDAHPALRTGFLWQDLDRPLQAVWRQVTLPLDQRDLRHLHHEAQRRQLDSWLEDDRTAGFDLRRPPLSRLLLVRLTETRYRFVWSYHHALLDGWSIAALFEAAFRVYRQLGEDGQAPSIPVTPLRDYIAWLEAGQATRHLEGRAFWRRRLQGLKRPSRLGRTTPSTHLQPRQTLHRSLDPSLSPRLEARARQLGITVAALVQGAWAVLLSRLLGTDDVVFGSTVSNRPPELPGVEHMVGLMINTLPVRRRVESRLDLEDWLLGMHQELLDIRQHPHHNLAEIQQWSPFPQGEALFDHLLVFENYPAEKAMESAQQQGDLHVFDYQGFDETNYPWTLGVLPGPPMRLDVSVDPVAIGTRQAARWLSRLAHLLELMASSTRRQVGDLPSLTPAERHQVLFEWGEGEPDTGGDGFLHRFLDRAHRNPEALAIISPHESAQWTYGRLLQRAASLAETLCEGQGTPLTREEPIGVLLERRSERIVATLAILLAGGVYVPLDITYPKAHLQLACHVAGVRRLVSRPGLAGETLGEALEDLDVVSPDVAGSGRPGSKLPSLLHTTARLRGERLAYVLLTSGSTGQPKAVAVSHRALHWYCRAALRQYQIDHHDRVAHVSPVAFDFSICEIFPALSCGGAVVLAPPKLDGSARQLFDFCRRHEISVLFPPTTRWHQLVDDVAQDPSMLPPSLRLLASGGEAVLPGKLLRWQTTVGPSPRLMSGYGPTEATVEASLVNLSDLDLASTSAADDGSVDAAPLGRPLPGVRMRVLDDEGRPLGTGQVGEIVLSGPGLARGYLGRPAATANRFLPDPFATTPGQRMYRTGDLGFFDVLGQLQFAGRRDWQLKIRGYRIEPGMVETALSRLDDIRAAAVIGRFDGKGGGWLEAFVVPSREEEAPWNPQAWRRALADRLPAHLLPARWHRLEALPLTPAGKVDRRRLTERAESRALQLAGNHDDELIAQPLTRPQQQLATIWQDVLGDDLCREALEPTSHFFALGGHSLLAARLVQTLRQRLGLDLVLRDVFLYPTLEEMAERLHPIPEPACSSASA